MSNRLSARWRAAIALVLLLGLGVAAERGRWYSRLMGIGSPERLWIWVTAWPREVRPRAFFLARDFDVASPTAGARLEVAADPEYIVRLNGRRIGSASYRPDSPIDVYDAGDLLRPGRNRLTLELRSPIGSGGVTLRLTDGTGRPLVATDGEWRVYAGAWRTLADLDRPLPEAPRAAVLGRAPFARWSLPAERERPAYLSEVERDALEPALAWRPARSAAEWAPFPRRRREPIGSGELVEVDFGREVAGYLHLDVVPSAPAEGMLFYASAEGDALDRAPDRVVVAVPELGFWQEVEPRRFRYVTLVGLPSLRAVSLIPLRAGAAVEPPRPLVRGLFGAPVEPSRSPMVEELRRRVLTDAVAAR